jgi:hypothetical protein
MKDLNTGRMDVKLRIFLTSKKGEWFPAPGKDRLINRGKKAGLNIVVKRNIPPLLPTTPPGYQVHRW